MMAAEEAGSFSLWGFPMLRWFSVKYAGLAALPMSWNSAQARARSGFAPIALHAFSESWATTREWW